MSSLAILIVVGIVTYGFTLDLRNQETQSNSNKKNSTNKVLGDAIEQYIKTVVQAQITAKKP